MSTVHRTAAALYAREVEVMAGFREFLRVKAAHELVVGVVYPSKAGAYWVQVPSPAGLLGPDGAPATQLVRVHALGVRLAEPPTHPTSRRTDAQTVTIRLESTWTP